MRCMEVPDARESESLLPQGKPPPRDTETVALDGDNVAQSSSSADLGEDGAVSDPLERNKQNLNTMFGFRPFGYHVSKKPNRPIDDGEKRDYAGS